MAMTLNAVGPGSTLPEAEPGAEPAAAGAACRLLEWPDLDGLDEPATLRERVARVPRWFHRFELPGGVITPGHYAPAEKLDRVRLPERLDGMSVLDVGAWDGFYTFECERRGAGRVTSVDLWNPSVSASSEGYAVAHAAFGSTATPVRASVHDLDPAVHGTHDLVLFLGVLYHLTNPFDALVRIRSVTAGTAIIETASDLAFTRRPALAFYEDAQLGRDASNWFAPNGPGLLAMCRAAGFRQARLVWKMSLPARLARAVYRAKTHGDRLLPGIARGRIVVHATV